jgi:SAM-dependent methyltransferase
MIPAPADGLPPSTRAHLDSVQAFYEAAPTTAGWGARGYRALLARCYNQLIPADAAVLEIGCGAGELLARLGGGRKAGIDLAERQIAAARRRLPEGVFCALAGECLAGEARGDVVVISDTLNLAADVQRLLERIQDPTNPDLLLLVNFQNSLWRPILWLARATGLKSPQPENSWLAGSDVRNLLRLAGWCPVTQQGRILLPLPCLGLEQLVNRWIAPFCPWFCLTVFVAARPLRPAARAPLTVSIVIPVRDEVGNIVEAVRRTPEMGAGCELIFVEGNSRDGTWAELERVAAANPHRRITRLRQPGGGKGDAVRAGFAAATGDLLMILDADLTVAPEELPKFYDAIASGRAELANGVRLIYPREGRAMPFLNLCANKAFSLLFTWLLGQPVKDTLCGTKALSRTHYERLARNRRALGEFDPFGDFDLLFGAAKLNLRIVDVPIRYQERTYGETKIKRWRHGALLLRMAGFAARRLKFV